MFHIWGEGWPLHACGRYNAFFSFTMFTVTTVLCNSTKLEIIRNNYPGILKIHQGNITEFCLYEMLVTLY